MGSVSSGSVVVISEVVVLGWVVVVVWLVVMVESGFDTESAGLFCVVFSVVIEVGLCVEPSAVVPELELQLTVTAIRNKISKSVAKDWAKRFIKKSFHKYYDSSLL